MRTGTAVQYDRYGGFDVVHVVPQPRPEPGPGEIVVEVITSGLNHVERFVREGKLQDHVDVTFPSGQGVDFAGIVARRGAGVKQFKVGAEVIGHAPHGGAHATWLTVPVEAVVPKPDSVTYEVAGGLYLAGCTALATIRGLRLGAGDTVVVSAAAGGVGHLECQLALAAGARVIGLGSAGNHDFLRQIGALPVRYGDGQEERIREIAGSRGVTAFIDNHGVPSAAPLAEALGVEPRRFVSSEQRRDTELRFLRAPADDREARELLQELASMVERHKLRVLISGFYPFEFIVDAYEDLAQMRSRGKVIVGMKTVETGSRLDWYRSEKSRTYRDAEDARREAGEARDSGAAAGGAGVAAAVDEDRLVEEERIPTDGVPVSGGAPVDGRATGAGAPADGPGSGAGPDGQAVDDAEHLPEEPNSAHPGGN